MRIVTTLRIAGCGLIPALVLSSCSEDLPTAVPRSNTSEPIWNVAYSAVPYTAELEADADTYVRQGHPNQSQGFDDALRIRANGNNRAILRFSTGGIASQVGTGTILSAHIELTIVDNGNNWGPDGRTLDLHRVTVPWSEEGGTWNCAVDADPDNQAADCEDETEWSMGGSGTRPWDSMPSSSTVIEKYQTGVVSLDVTEDVQGMLAGSIANNGWLLKKQKEGKPGRVEFGAREATGMAPRLVLMVQPGETLLFADDFSGSLSNWVNPNGQGTWVIQNDQLVGDYGIGCGSTTCPQSDLLLVDPLQPGSGNWRMEVSTILGQMYCCYRGGAIGNQGTFLLWAGTNEKEAFNAGKAWVGSPVPASADSLAWDHQIWYPWHRLNDGFGELAVGSWDPAQPQVMSLEKVGDTYTLKWNGITLYSVTRTFSQTPKIGLHTYGRMTLDDFKLYALP